MIEVISIEYPTRLQRIKEHLDDEDRPSYVAEPVVMPDGTPTLRRIAGYVLSTLSDNRSDKPTVAAVKKISESTPFHEFKKDPCGHIAVGEYFIGNLKSAHKKEYVRTRGFYAFGEPKPPCLERPPNATFYRRNRLSNGRFRDISFLSTNEYDDSFVYYPDWAGRIKYKEVHYNHSPMAIQEQQLEKLIGVTVDHGLVTDAIGNINKKTLDLLTAVAEFPEVINMILDALFGILKLCRNFKSEISRLGKEVLNGKKIAEVWLTYRYGIMPLLYTVRDGLSVLDKMNKGSVFVDEKTRREVIRPCPFYEDAIEVQTHRVYIKRRVDVLLGAQNHLSINPFVTAWELTSFSFMIDWVVNVGSFLSALTFTPNYQEQKATYSVKRKCFIDNEVIFIEYETYQRIKLNSPNLYIRPAFNPELNTKRCLDLLALARLILNRK